ncbi:MAG: putative esterase [Gemmatimonadetes bacterium]|nr:putative esterase [Gemmatimonadota bacterium]
MPTTRIRDIDVFHEEHGSGPTLLFIHGLGSSTEDWEAQVPFFADRYRVVTYDVRGHGRTTKPREKYSLQQFSDDAAALVEQLGDAPVHVVGLSMGGMIAFQLAADRPDLVRTLTVVNSGPEMVLRTFAQKFAIFQRRWIVQMMGLRKWGAVLADRLLPGDEFVALRGKIVERWARNDKRSYLRALRALVGWTVTARLPAITQPTLILTADMDYTPIPWKQHYTSLIPGARLVIIPNTRHFLPLERPELFNRALDEFLTATAAIPSATVTTGARAGVAR